MEQIQLQDLSVLRFPAQLAVSPASTRCAWLEYTPDISGNCYHASLWRYNDDVQRTCLQSFSKHIKSFAWKDEDHIVYISPTPSGSQIRCIDLKSGNDQLLFSAPYACSLIHTLSKNRYVLLISERYKTPPDSEAMILDEIPFWFNGQGFTNGLRTRLCLWDSGTFTPISPEDSEIGVISVRSDEILYSIRRPIDRKMKFAALFRYNAQSGTSEELIPPDIYDIFYAARVGAEIIVCATDMKKYGNVQNPSFYLVQKNGLTMIADPDLGVTNDITSDMRYSSSSQWSVSSHHLYFIGTTRLGSCLYRISNDGGLERLTPDNGQTVAGVAGSHGIMALILEQRERCGEVYWLKHPNEMQKISQCNDSYFSTHQAILPEHFTFSSRADTALLLDGFILRPKGYQPGHSYPGILQIHGGPKLAYGQCFHHEMQAMAAKGWFVFYCNPRGSDGRGSEFMDVRGSYGTVDYEDIMGFTDEVLKHYPELDPKRIAVCGGSYGGYMVNWIIGHTDRFCCAVSQRSISNWFSMFCAGDTGYRFVADQLDGTPWTQERRFWEQSPLRYACNVHTPTLFIHSTQDYRCNMLEGLQMFTALRYFQVESRLCLIQGENHDLSRSGRPLQRIRRLTEMFDWLEAHFKQ